MPAGSSSSWRIIAANARRGKKAAISPIALEAIKRVDALFDIERGINGQSAEQRLRVRKEQSAPLVTRLEAWLREQRPRLSRSSSVAEPSTTCFAAGIGSPDSSTTAASA
jgi:transposase